MDWKKRVFELKGEVEFEMLALEIYAFQRENNPVLKQYLDLLGVGEIERLEDIVYLPIRFFKNHDILSIPKSGKETLFLSSGTGDVGRSKHQIPDILWYEISFEKTYRLLFGQPENQVILALLPNYLEQGNSSLVYMVNKLVKITNNDLSGFVLGQTEDVVRAYNEAIAKGKEVVLFGVSYALLDLIEQGISLPKAKIIETGGMKGRRTEETKAVLHDLLKSGFGVDRIYSEYGMTELLSQAYSSDFNDFRCPPWMKVTFAELNDPLSATNGVRKSRINVIDLANFQTCSFIQTDDTGRKTEFGFSLEGRMDLAELRGCNLML
jgi:hypothetical protein